MEFGKSQRVPFKVENTTCYMQEDQGFDRHILVQCIWQSSALRWWAWPPRGRARPEGTSHHHSSPTRGERKQLEYEMEVLFVQTIRRVIRISYRLGAEDSFGIVIINRCHAKQTVYKAHLSKGRGVWGYAPPPPPPENF